jgi:hypothetical protein
MADRLTEGQASAARGASGIPGELGSFLQFILEAVGNKARAFNEASSSFQPGAPNQDISPLMNEVLSFAPGGVTLGKYKPSSTGAQPVLDRLRKEHTEFFGRRGQGDITMDKLIEDLVGDVASYSARSVVPGTRIYGGLSGARRAWALPRVTGMVDELRALPVDETMSVLQQLDKYGLLEDTILTRTLDQLHKQGTISKTQHPTIDPRVSARFRRFARETEPD